MVRGAGITDCLVIRGQFLLRTSFRAECLWHVWSRPPEGPGGCPGGGGADGGGGGGGGNRIAPPPRGQSRPSPQALPLQAFRATALPHGRMALRRGGRGSTGGHGRVEHRPIAIPQRLRTRPSRPRGAGVCGITSDTQPPPPPRRPVSRAAGHTPGPHVLSRTAADGGPLPRGPGRAPSSTAPRRARAPGSGGGPGGITKRRTAATDACHRGTPASLRHLRTCSGSGGSAWGGGPAPPQSRCARRRGPGPGAPEEADPPSRRTGPSIAAPWPYRYARLLDRCPAPPTQWPRGPAFMRRPGRVLGIPPGAFRAPPDGVRAPTQSPGPEGVQLHRRTTSPLPLGHCRRGVPAARARGGSVSWPRTGPGAACGVRSDRAPADGGGTAGGPPQVKYPSRVHSSCPPSTRRTSPVT